MLNSIRRVLRDKKQLNEFRGLDERRRNLVVFCDSPGMAVHLDPIVRDMIDTFGIEISYFTTDPADPRIHQSTPGVHAFCLETPALQTWFFKSLETCLFVTTTPDLGSSGYPRSVHPVHYAYIHHSMVSTHMIYRGAAFDQFDTVFCCGPHHEQEIRAREKNLDLPPKTLVAHGSARLDELLEAADGHPMPSETSPVLIAPSWGPTGLLETCGSEVVRRYVEAGIHVLLRPHPETLRRTPKIVNDIVGAFAGNAFFHYDPDVSSLDALLQSRIMVSDWSGAALEFAMGLERPVIFVDVPRKVNNSEYELLKIEPIEVGLRSQIGKIVSPAEIHELPAITTDLISQDWRQRCREARENHIHNPGSSTKFAAKSLFDLYQRIEASGNAPDELEVS